ncbi:MAG: phospho-sugar mutase [Clostridia bacterium]|nr:phospho-sugar mutase [Clostridia bacterium]
MTANERYLTWLSDSCLDENTRKELEGIKDDAKQIEDRFYKDLEFGTGGLRGVLGAGTNRMNIYTVRRAAAGLAEQLLEECPDAKEKGVAIAHDSRILSREFAVDSALVMAEKGIPAYLFDELRPTPELSFAIKHLGCVAGIVVTASHNPAQYNGFKAYGRDGGQITPNTADQVLARMAQIDPIRVSLMDEKEAKEKGLLKIIGSEVDNAYIDHVLSLRPDPDLLTRTGVKLKIVYTPLHGAGNKLVRAALKRAGYEDVTVVKEQEAPDGNFPTVASPNPENSEAFEIAIKYADEIEADVIVGTDPDSDRMGMMLKKDGKWIPVSGNQAGCLMLEYILAAKKPAPGSGAYAVTTIVSTRLVDAIAKKYGAEIKRVLTGFKFIGEVIDNQEKAGNNGFLLGFEESYGYLTGGYIRDKDAVIASLLACELAAYFKSQGKSLFDALEAMYKEYGYAAEKTISVTMPGVDGMAKREKVTADLRACPPSEIGGRKVLEALDFKQGGVMGLPKADVLLYKLENDAWVCVRPSGTEPKLKIYAGVLEDSAEKASEQVQLLSKAAAAFGN